MTNPQRVDVERLREVVAFLLGDGELDNRWFGDGYAPLVAGKYRAPYWWRTQLRETTAALLQQLAEYKDFKRLADEANETLKTMCAAAESKLAEREAELAMEQRHYAQAREDYAFLSAEFRRQLEAAERAREEMRSWVCHNGGLLNEWVKEWSPARDGTLTDFIGKRLDAAFLAAPK